MMRRSPATIAAAAIAIAAIGATPGGEPEIDDGCGDTGTRVNGEAVDHPTPEGTDVDTVTFGGIYGDAEPGEEPPLLGFDVVIETCGELLPVATDETFRVLWDAPVRPGCDAVYGDVQLRRDARTDQFEASYAQSCLVIEQGGGSSSSELTEIFRESLPTGALSVEATTYALTVLLAEVSSEAEATLEDGTTFASPRVFASTFAGTNLETGAVNSDGTGAWVSLIERSAPGTDFTLGQDRPEGS